LVRKRLRVRKSLDILVCNFLCVCVRERERSDKRTSGSREVWKQIF
jgi:hypothetical protein